MTEENRAHAQPRHIVAHDQEQAVAQQLDYMAARITDLENHMIDPQTYGRMEGQVAALRVDVDRLLVDVADMRRTLSQIQDQLAQARGGWRIMMAIGGGGAGLGALLASLLHWRPGP